MVYLSFWTQFSICLSHAIPQPHLLDIVLELRSGLAISFWGSHAQLSTNLVISESLEPVSLQPVSLESVFLEPVSLAAFPSYLSSQIRARV